MMDGIVYAIGGFNYNYLISVEMLSPGSAGWVPGPSLPEAVYHPQAVVYHNSIFLFSSFYVYRLDNGTDEWVKVKHDSNFLNGRSVFPSPLLSDSNLLNCN